ncbi:heavy metal-binding domain-containing protein [Cellulophaga sp. E6(2014)]|uniref:heavy metal-binding domain-containing protein n=1 Tax=Cellulophaga sp. E6(2014) TaxID=1495334 RepID=UPI0005506D48|nr:heavy metal-binding domain-containing protein [Cellulophaga sp. E6(2014)]
MKFRVILLPIVICLVTLSIFTACKDKREEVKPDRISEIAEAIYSCPMNCEDGKTYHEAGSCPVCKMDLMLTDKEIGATCQAHKDGKCSCEGEQCICANCQEHAKKMTCTIGEDGKCTDKNCKKHQKNKDCVMNKDGKCICESGKCTCVDCASKNQ